MLPVTHTDDLHKRFWGIMQKRAHIIKEEQRKSFYMRQIAQLLHKAGEDDSSLLELYVTRLEFSAGKGACHVYFGCVRGKEFFDEVLEKLKLYRPSMRKALSRARQSRYTPDLFFHYDSGMDNVYRVEELFNTIANEADTTG